MKLIKSITFFIFIFMFIFGTGLIERGYGGDFFPTGFSLNMFQIYKSKISGKEKKVRAFLDYQNPSKMKFEVKGKNALTLIYNGKTMWRYSPPFIEGEAGQLKILEGQRPSLLDFFDLLKSGLKSNKEYTVKKDKLSAKITFSKAVQKRLQIKEGLIKFNSENKIFSSMSSIEIMQNDGRSIQLEVIDVTQKKNFSKNHFYFYPPKNTKLIN